LKKKHSFFRFRYLFSIFLIGVVALGIYLFALDYKIRTKFESHRWNLPSRVYSDAFYLYPGQAISPMKIEKKLERLGYKRINTQAKNVGEFSRSGTAVTVFLRNFSYPSEEFPGYPVRLEFSEERLTKIEKIDDGEELKKVKLEPELIASIFDEKMEDRTLVPLSEIPEELVQAVVAVEDERYYSHHGVDPLAIVRAFLTDLLHFKAVQGGSTLTQQLVKNYFLTADKTFVRKFNEMFMAILLELRYSKEEVLEAYFNEIYFGQRGPISVTGAEEASKLYFAKGVAHLSLAESALLAGLIRSPGEYSPFKNITKTYDRRNFVLKSMKEKGFIDGGEYEEARKEKIVLAQGNSKVFQAPYFVDFVRNELRANYPADILKSEGLKIFTTLDMEAQEIAEGAVQRRLDELEKGRPKLKKMREEGKVLEGALVAVQPQTGAIQAFVGGRDYEMSQFDRIADAHRQPGSAFKPFVYLTALASEDEKRYSLASTVEDRSFSVRVGGKEWKPDNYDKTEHGTVTLREALEQSYNLATSKLAIDVGLEKIVKTAREAGIESPLQPYPALALGAFEVTPLELVRAYTIFPNQGTRAEPIAITSLVTREGVVLEKKGFRMKKVVSPELAYLMNSALRGVLDRGTAASARTLGFTGLAAGKTGTTSDYRDSWFVGYTPDLLALAWVGYDDGTATGLSGSSGALPVWAEFMRKVDPAGAHRIDFPATEEILLVKVSKSGKLYKEECGEAVEEAFLRGTEPQVYCNEEDSEP
jgi:penicillin-binding protein 1B